MQLEGVSGGYDNVIWIKEVKFGDLAIGYLFDGLFPYRAFCGIWRELIVCGI